MRITEFEWETRFRPINDSLLSELPLGVDPHHVWTQTDAGDGWTVYAGFCYVDRMGYWLTEMPWTDAEMFFTSDHAREDDEDDEDVAA